MFGPSNCTFEAAPTVAKLATDQQGKKFRAELIGPGTITETCGDTKTVYDVLQATAGRIDRKDGAAGSEYFVFVPMAGTREPKGVVHGGTSPTGRSARTATASRPLVLCWARQTAEARTSLVPSWVRSQEHARSSPQPSASLRERPCNSSDGFQLYEFFSACLSAKLT